MQILPGPEAAARRGAKEEQLNQPLRLPQKSGKFIQRHHRLPQRLEQVHDGYLRLQVSQSIIASIHFEST